MKKSALLNSELSYVIAKMGHTDTLTVWGSWTANSTGDPANRSCA